MDGGIDYAYTKMFNNIQQFLQKKLRNDLRTPTSFLGRKYLPVGGALLLKINEEYSLIAAPTMLMPQNVKNTNNAYYAMKAILKVWPGNGTLIIPILGGGIGKISPDEVNRQLVKAMNDYTGYILDSLYLPPLEEGIKILNEQPKYYENTEFIEINPNEISNH